jgi:Flp pilus assembly protein TadG
MNWTELMKLFLRQRRVCKRQNRFGSATVELAVCFPIFMVILLGIVEFGRAMSVNQMLNSAARIGCRAAILDGSTNTNVTSVVKQHVTNTLGCQSSSVNVAITATSSKNGATLSDVSQASTGDLIQLDVFVPFGDVSWGVKRWMGTANVRGECSMQHE